MPKINPFKPNSPVPIGMFAGRLEEIQALQNGLLQTSTGYSKHFLIKGERGIGKSSLLMLLESMARGEVKDIDGRYYNFLTISCSISKHTTLATFIQLIERTLKREMGKVEKIRTFLDDTWAFVQRIKIMDSGIDSAVAPEDIDLILDDFCHSLATTCNRLTNPDKGEEAKDGIVILVDEADNSCPELHLGYFLKITTENLSRHHCNNVMFVLAGLPEIVEKLSESHPSSVRIAKQLYIRELNPDDRKYVVDRGLDTANTINHDSTTITTPAKDLISTLSEGYPHFIQQFAYSAFEFNKDHEISDSDVIHAAFDPGGAIDEIGTQYYQSAYHEQIKSDAYREVLTIMADNLNAWIKKSEIRQKFSGSDQTLTDALKALTTRRIILKNPSKLGEYRLQQRGFALWIKLFGQRRR